MRSLVRRYKILHESNESTVHYNFALAIYILVHGSTCTYMKRHLRKFDLIPYGILDSSAPEFPSSPASFHVPR